MPSSKAPRKDQTETEVKAPADNSAKITAEREKNAHPGFFLRSATWLLSRFPLTKDKYQNWTSGRRILVGWILWIICLPIIPLVVIAVWYARDPEGFKKSPVAKGLIALTVAWAVGFGFIATSPAQLDQNGLYSPIQTEANGEQATAEQVAKKPAATASDEAKKKVADQKESKSSDGKKFENCTDAFDAGVFNIKRSDSAYSSSLDRDDDGIACEK